MKCRFISLSIPNPDSRCPGDHRAADRRTAADCTRGNTAEEADSPDSSGLAGSRVWPLAEFTIASQVLAAASVSSSRNTQAKPNLPYQVSATHSDRGIAAPYHSP